MWADLFGLVLQLCLVAARQGCRGPRTIADDLGLQVAEVQSYMLGLTPTAVSGSSTRTARRAGDHLRIVTPDRSQAS